MPTDSVTPVAATGMYTTPPTRAPKQTMDGEMFMHLLVTQLQNQDPSSPMDTNQMISQSTQLAMMESIATMTTTSEENFSLQMRGVAAALVGQQVSYYGQDGALITGTATSVSYAGPVPQVIVDGKEIPLDLIAGINAATPGDPGSGDDGAPSSGGSGTDGAGTGATGTSGGAA
ncbi:flagellar hook capping protein [Arthrobacter sp. CAU 1506]|uniref:flagellar hook assembly protein FlgD n=1 Tax=Arthrobacter sp. CAU 1506 TaxID=2560052 RepID=UPI0010ACF700|nr:flagellar hook capping FlgD N-terminal domain-containing protein [Arthrobacter sp. CAU 1506]TJY71496.1 flagellar hook capping protein [Arthrobacter sp. CAU 1506]